MRNLMRNKRQQLYTCLTLFKQDIREIIQLFQNNLQDVEIFIDDLRILDIAQLDQFDPTSQAKSLLARGYDHKTGAADTKLSDERLLIELKMSSISMLLLAPKEADLANPKALLQIRMLLLRCQNSSQQSLIMLAFSIIFFSPISIMQLVSHQYHLAFIMQLLVTVVGTLLLGPLMAFFLVKIVRLLRIDTRVFLWPGATNTTQTYGRRSAFGTIMIALAIVCVFSFIIIYIPEILWR